MANSITVEEILNAIAVPTTVGSWQSDEVVPDEPWLEYHRAGSDDISGDDLIYQKRDVWKFSLYGKQKNAFDFWDKTNEIEKTLDELEVVYDRSGDIFFDDCLYTIYTVTINR